MPFYGKVGVSYPRALSSLYFPFSFLCETLAFVNNFLFWIVTYWSDNYPSRTSLKAASSTMPSSVSLLSFAASQHSTLAEHHSHGTWPSLPEFTVIAICIPLPSLDQRLANSVSGQIVIILGCVGCIVSVVTPQFCCSSRKAAIISTSMD